MRGSTGHRVPGSPTPPEKSQSYKFLSNTGSGRLKNPKANQPSFNAGPPLTHKRYAIQIAFRLRFDDDPLLVVFGSLDPLSSSTYCTYILYLSNTLKLHGPSICVLNAWMNGN